MSLYANKSYGRIAEVHTIYQLFDSGRDVSMPGPRRLGKTFTLDRLVDASEKQGWVAVKVEVAGCTDAPSVFRALCEKIGGKRSGGEQAIRWVKQRFTQLLNPRQESGGPWYQPFLSLDHTTYFERLIRALNDDPERRWVLLIDELPIFLKALHDKGPDGVAAARNFMNLTSRLRTDNPNVRWLITGSIGLEPLARAGNYMGVLAKYETFTLKPLERQQAKDFVKDLAVSGELPNRDIITDAEAEALIDAVGWLAAYYLDAFARKLEGQPQAESEPAALAVKGALERLLQPTEITTFGVWEEHLRKHYRDPDQARAFAALGVLAPHPQGLNLDGILSGIGETNLKREELFHLLQRLHVEGFLAVSDWEDESALWIVLNPLLRHWWQRFKPQA